MTSEQTADRDPRIAQAVAELQDVIREHYPSATFDVAPGDDPPGTYLWTAVDTEDTDQVLDNVIDRLLEMQIDQGLLIHVIPIRTSERVKATIQAVASGRRGSGRRRGAPSLDRVHLTSKVSHQA